MSEYLNNTKARRKENYDFLQQIMQNNQINFETLISPKTDKQSFTSSQLTDQVIRMVNHKSPIDMVSPTDNFTSPKEQIVPTDYDLDGDMPIINEIDNIIDRIKSKYQTQKLSPQPVQKQIIQLVEPQQVDEIMSTLKGKIQNEKQMRSPVKSDKQPIQQQQMEQIQNSADVSSQSNSTIKQQVKRLQNTFKPPPSSTKPPISATQSDKMRILNNEDEDEIKQEIPIQQQTQPTQQQPTPSPVKYIDNHDNQQQQLPQPELQYSDYKTPIKRLDIDSQLSYSQSGINSENRFAFQQSIQQSPYASQSFKPLGNIYDDPILEQLIQEEQQLLTRLQILRTMAKNDEYIIS